MKALIYTGPQSVEVQSVPEPVPQDGQVLLRVRYCGICGSDIGIFQGKHPRAKAPLILGHEFVGFVEQSNGCKQEWETGQRAAAYPLRSCGHCYPCRTGSPHICQSLGLLGIDTDGGIAEYVCVNEADLVRLPEELSDRAAALIEPLAVIVHAVHRSGFRYGDSAVVLGCGPIGLLTAIVLRHAGASAIVVSEADKKRAEMSRSMGFHTVLAEEGAIEDTVRLLTNGTGADVTFECSGNAVTTFQSTAITRVGGTICMVGQHKTPPVCNLPEFSFKEQTLRATRVYEKEEFFQTARYAVRMQEELEQVVTHTVGLPESGKVFDMIADPAVATMKVLVDCTPA